MAALLMKTAAFKVEGMENQTGGDVDRSGFAGYFVGHSTITYRYYIYIYNLLIGPITTLKCCLPHLYIISRYNFHTWN